MSQYFEVQGVKFPADANPAEYMIDVVSGDRSKERDWAKVWLESDHRIQRMAELEKLNHEAADQPPVEDEYEFASPFLVQVSIVCERAFVQVSCRAVNANHSSGETSSTFQTSLHCIYVGEAVVAV